MFFLGKEKSCFGFEDLLTSLLLIKIRIGPYILDFIDFTQVLSA